MVKLSAAPFASACEHLGRLMAKWRLQPWTARKRLAGIWQ
jgi:hypothetical protein